MRVDLNFYITRSSSQRSSWHGRCRLLFCISRGWSLRLVEESDVFKTSTFKKLLESNQLNIPDPGVLPRDAERLSMPFVLVGDVTRPSPYQSICYGHITTKS